MRDAALIVSFAVIALLMYAQWRIGRLKNEVTQLRGQLARLEARRSARLVRRAPPLWHRL